MKQNTNIMEPNNEPRKYRKLDENTQMEVCKHFHEGQYNDSSLEDIHNAFLEVNPGVQYVEHPKVGYIIHEMYRLQFEDHLKQAKAAK